MSTALCYGQTLTTVTAQGEGRTMSQALDQAKRNAVEQGLGSVISSETITKNFQLASDRIFSRADGFVKNFKQISSSTTEDGYYVIEIEAVVTDMLDEIMKDQMAIDLLLQWMEMPRFMILIDENNLGEKSFAAETELARRLTERHFDLVARSQVDAIRNKRTALAALEGDLNAAAQIALDFGAEMLVIGKAETHEGGGSVYMEGTGMKSATSDFSAQIISASDARILASYTSQASGMQVSLPSSGVAALKNSAQMMADSLVAFLLKSGSRKQVNTRSITLLLNGVGFRDIKNITQSLEELPEVSAVYQRSFKSPNAELAIEIFGSAMDLAMVVDGMKFGEKTAEIVSIDGTNISVNLK